MIVQTKNLEFAKEAATRYSTRNGVKVYLFAVHSGDHQILWFEMYPEGDPDMARYWSGRQPAATVPE